MDKPFVSIFMPVYNAGPFVKEAIQSILEQTYFHFELIIINDGSRDNSDAVIQSFKDNRIRYLLHETNLGIAKTRKEGIAIAKGKYLFWMDADDISLPERIVKQVALFEKNADIIIVGTYAEGIDKHGDVKKWYVYPTLETEIKARLLFGFPFINPSIGMRLSALRQIDLSFLNEITYAQDYAIISKLHGIGIFQNIPEFLIKYREFESPTRVTKDNNSSEIIKGRMFAWRNMLSEFQVEISNDMLQVHDKFCYYSQRILNEEIKRIPAYFRFLLDLLVKNDKIVVFDRTCFQRNIVSQLERVLTYPHLPINTFISLWFKSVSIIPPGVFFSIPYKSMKHRLKSSKQGRWMIKRIKQAT
jgi:glycosyltransferase involved in cell wall biosynthesis